MRLPGKARPASAKASARSRQSSRRCGANEGGRRQQLTGAAAGTLGRDEKRPPVPEGVNGVIDRARRLLFVAALDRHETHDAERAAENRQLLEFRLI